MIHFLSTSLLQSDAQTVVNTVNTVGVMGKGLAEHFRKANPDMFKVYKRLCEQGLLDVGKLWLWKGSRPWVLNFPTKKHWRQPSRLEYVQAGLEKFRLGYEAQGIREISFPRLGCGNGGLDWDIVRPLMERCLGDLPISIYIHDFEADIGAPEHDLPSQAGGRFTDSFDSFLEDVRSLISARSHQFRTLFELKPFQARLDGADLVVWMPSQPETRVSNDDLYEAWNRLSNGPVTASRLVGTAQSAPDLVLGLVASLPYTRAFKLRSPTDPQPVAAVEMIGSGLETQELEAETITP